MMMIDPMAPEDPTPEMIDRGVAVMRRNEHSPPETRVHDIWQAMMDEWLASLGTIDE
jgi:hypothetical protein